jgi:polar amino acid transport system substrate-binding protein
VPAGRPAAAGRCYLPAARGEVFFCRTPGAGEGGPAIAEPPRRRAPLARRWRCAALAGLAALAFLASSCAERAAPGGAPPADALDRVRAAGVLRWGCDAEGGAPYVYKDPDALNSYVGFEVEVAGAIAKELGVRAERVQNQWSVLLPGLGRGDFDIALNGIEITPERQQEVLFSRPYYAASLEVTVRKGDIPPTSLAALRGKRVGSLTESFAWRLLKSAGGIDVSQYEGQVGPYLDLKVKRIEAVVMDVPIARYYGSGPEFENAVADFGAAQYGIAIRKGETRLAAAIDAALDHLAASGELRRIYERYGIWNRATAEMLGDPDPTPRSEPVMLRRFQRASQPLTLLGRLQRYLTVYLPLLAYGAAMTLAISVVGMTIAIALGLMLALMRVYGPRPLRWLSIVYIEGIRGTPLLIQLYIIFYALPEVGLNFGKFTAAVIGLGLNYAAYEAENYRAGLTSIAIGQTEAAHALGLTQLQTLRYVIVPQALRLVIPPVTNDFIALLKDSSIVSVIAMVELTEIYNELASATGDRFGIGLLAGLLYFLLGLPFARLAQWLEARARRGRR